MLGQFCIDISETAFNENNGVTQNVIAMRSGATSLLSIRAVSLALLQRECKRALTPFKDCATK